MTGRNNWLVAVSGLRPLHTNIEVEQVGRVMVGCFQLIELGCRKYGHPNYLSGVPRRQVEFQPAELTLSQPCM
jgi:hypothetical protein